MTKRLGLIVTDASPLITLGAAQALACLIMPEMRVFVPDMVYAEVARDMTKLGARDIVDWIRQHLGQVEIVPTEVHAEYEALRAINPNIRSKRRGEQAALEVLAHEAASDPDLHAILLFVDSDIRSREFVRVLPKRAAAFSTGDLLRELEFAGRIQSSGRILDEAAARGRNVERQRQAIAGEPARALSREQLLRRNEPRGGG